MSDQRELSLTDCEAVCVPPPAPPLLQRLLDLAGLSALRSLGSPIPEKEGTDVWDGLEPLDLLRGWRCADE